MCFAIPTDVPSLTPASLVPSFATPQTGGGTTGIAPLPPRKAKPASASTFAADKKKAKTPAGEERLKSSLLGDIFTDY